MDATDAPIIGMAQPNLIAHTYLDDTTGCRCIVGTFMDDDEIPPISSTTFLLPKPRRLSNLTEDQIFYLSRINDTALNTENPYGWKKAIAKYSEKLTQLGFDMERINAVLADAIHD